MNPVFPWNWSFRQFLCQSTYFSTQKLVKPHVIVQWKKQDLISILWLRAKKLDLWFHKRETHVPLSQMDTQISNFLFFSSFLTKISIFLLRFAGISATISTQNFHFYLILSHFYELGWNRAEFQNGFTETGQSFMKPAAFHWNWAQKKALFFVPFWHKIG